MTDIVAIYDPASGSPTKTRWYYTNFALKRRDYRALEVEAQGRIGERWTLRGSYTWSQAKGTNPGQFEAYSWDTTWGAAWS